VLGAVVPVPALVSGKPLRAQSHGPTAGWLAGCLPARCLPVQGELLLLALKHMRGGSLGSVLKNPETCHMLQWENRCVPACRLCSGCAPPHALHPVPAYHVAPCGSHVAPWGGLADTLAIQLAALAPCCSYCRGRQVAIDIAEALDHLHSELKVMHSDLKTR
jgi:hypothetical protein